MVIHGKRTSARLQKLNEEKILLHPLEEINASQPPPTKKPKSIHQRKTDLPDVVPQFPPAVRNEVALVAAPIENSNEGQVVGEKSAYAMVISTLRTFNTHHLHFVQEEEKRCEKLGAEEEKRCEKLRAEVEKGGEKLRADIMKHKGSKSKKKVLNEEKPEQITKKSMKRADLKTMSQMIKSNTVLNRNNRLGSIPGIDVGHQFFSRCEMVVVGIHNHWLNGIDYIGKSDRKMFKEYTLPLTVAIVLSGQYEDDFDNCEDIIYTGQGGNDLLGNKHQIKDQKLERGNLGLKKCKDQNVPVRVIRGHKSKSKRCYVGKVYTYDGLYKVVDYWEEKGVSGFTVYKFQLKRIEGQPPVMTDQVHFIRGHIPNSTSEIHGLVCEDISGGQENLPIRATNLVDVPPVAPTGFTYREPLQLSKSVSLPIRNTGCNCMGKCVDPRLCACARLNGSDFPYVHRDGGRLIEPKAVVFECGPKCGCGPDCVNRISQRGLKYRLEVFRTPKKGWAVRSWDCIPSGAPVCEYTGVLKKTDDVDSSPENNYIFDIDCLQTMKGVDGRERRIGDVSLGSLLDKDEDKDNGPEFCIDAGDTGNVARFINHSCQPNLFVQCVLSNHHDIKLARVVLFAADNIPPLQELTYDYGYALDSVMGTDGKVKQLACYCGAPDCRKRLF